MSDVAIRVEGLGKQYHLGAQQERYHTFADQIRKWTSVRKLFRRGKRAESRPPFWALKDVSFEVKRGEVVGIIGRNGAGKSTLLKILSRITEPTEGGADIHGRVGSLLEVGTGFHPELTGRENVYLNGAILGMKRSEIVRKFDEIVAFAEVEKFIDTPVKHYSSGMYMRLAFAVAAHLDPEILVVDEVLAVGDAQFQKKCLGKMGEVAKGGRTVLFVSHNMAVVSQICERTVLLNAGQVERDGLSSDVTSYYLASAVKISAAGERDLADALRSEGDGKIRFHRITLRNATGIITSVFEYGEPIRITLRFQSKIENRSGVFGVSVRTLTDVFLLTSASDDHQSPYAIAQGDYELEISIDPNHLRPGVYWLQIGNTCGTVRDVIPEAIQFKIDDARHYSKTCIHGLPGYFHFPFSWSTPRLVGEPIEFKL